METGDRVKAGQVLAPVAARNFAEAAAVRFQLAGPGRSCAAQLEEESLHSEQKQAETELAGEDLLESGALARVGLDKLFLR